ncbi:M20 family metallopeptidase [Tundrisphaera lichenicola]|uniref:M20 family metallopeptidase n=1 Tax=Tundrisphaera lichenicola TaxID=2029860 RepID=UPI003EC07C12
MPGSLIHEMLRSREVEWLGALRQLVEFESPSRDKPALDRLADRLVEGAESFGGEVERFANPSGGDHLLARFFGRETSEKPILILGHFDTVWPMGTLATMPFRVESGKAFGPGVFDMKASLILVDFAIDSLRKLGLQPARPVELLLTSDEEIGSPTSRSLIEDRARASSHVLVVEPPLTDGSLKTARKGVGAFKIEVEGRPAHAGVEPEKGISAIEELARLVLRLHDLNDPAAGISVNVGIIEGGTTPNVVAARASARIDVRARTQSQALVLEESIRSIAPGHPEAKLTIRGGFNRPPMERTPEVGRLFELARSLGQSIGLELGEGSTGGGSDGNFTAALGLPTLDGLGCRGAGAHADHEQVELESLPERAALLALLLLNL